MDTIPLTMANRIKAARGARGITEIAKIIGVHRTTLHAWEAGKRSPESEHLAAFARTCGVTVEWLVYGSATISTTAV